MTQRLTNMVKKAVGLLTVLMLLSASVSLAQNNNPVKVNETSLKNLITGINSDNHGLKRSCIYLAGKYKLTEILNTLVAKLEKEEDSNTRILIALSLYQIGEEKGLSAVKDAAYNDEDAKVRKICIEIYNAYVQNNYTASAEM
jgi:hypothetical protein